MSASSSPAGTDLESALEVLVDLLPVDCAAASSLGHPFAVETLAVTTMLAATLDETQIDLGQGPAWEAFGTRRPVVLQCDDSDDRRRWPFVEAALSRHGIATATALPLRFGALDIGAVSLYSRLPVRFRPEQTALAEELTLVVAHRLIARMTDDGDRADPLLSRRDIHTAAITLSRLTRLSPADALLAMRARAFTAGVSVRDVAADLNTGRLALARDLGLLDGLR
ncbi:GAF domain-containing protein [Rathayibacter sp. VKM Ac-2759]|uniref:GAF and ANTAR domain-containing protein n=1 Tax=Rathayibacter sp. VKM Ac-2759 TaxID=2609252 RepID=UPI0013169F34|nr:GAF and ANTAR domain-containing protein [Rathayibacter sp. VKM Ac-2759]QHC68109.1 GAF domain-containing protein [Rathayibacter sp. VKM Ac-2759]